MHSLYDVLLTQHARQLTPVRCAQQTIAQLHRYFEDVVLENNLSALVVESLPLSPRRPAREKARLREIASGGRRSFFFVSQRDSLGDILNGVGLDTGSEPVVLQRGEQDLINEHFVVIADARFSALLATVRGRDSDGTAGGDEVFWTFEPDIVYSALEYLMARVGAEHPYQAAAFRSAVHTSMPKATSLQLTVSVTTKLAHLLQEQASREIAVSRIATAIRDSLELGLVLQTTVNEVGRALGATCCALRVDGQVPDKALTYFYPAEESTADTLEREAAVREFDIYSSRFAKSPEPLVRDGCEETDRVEGEAPLVVMPLIFHERFMGALLVASGDAVRSWHEHELLLLHTVADQVAVAINHADLFAQLQQQALTDVLTGCFNRRSFEMQLDRELQMANRLSQPLSLVMLDLDRFKELNDSSGHDVGDTALRLLAECFRRELRGIDSAARFGGDEFALILPQADSEGAMLVAERLRKGIEQIAFPGCPSLTASIGIATFPEHGSCRGDLVIAADRALYIAKRAGRNRVCIAQPALMDVLDESDEVLESAPPIGDESLRTTNESRV